MLILSGDSAQLAYTCGLLTRDPATEHTIPPSAFCFTDTGYYWSAVSF